MGKIKPDSIDARIDKSFYLLLTLRSRTQSSHDFRFSYSQFFSSFSLKTGIFSFSLFK